MRSFAKAVDFLSAATVGCALLCFGCASGPFGVRPEIRNAGDGGEGREEITIQFEIFDEDLTRPTVAFEYYWGGAWCEATITAATVDGTGTGVSRNLMVMDSAAADWTPCTVTWDTLADQVALGGEDTVTLRLTPLDFDGVGDPVEHQVTVKNSYPTLDVDTGSLSFEYVYGSGVNPAAQAVNVGNPGASGTTLVWSIDPASLPAAPPWLSADTMGGTVVYGDPAVPVSFSVDPAGQSLVVGTYEADVAFAGEDTLGEAANGSPFLLHVTLTVRAPRPEIAIEDVGAAPLTDLYFTAFEGGSNPTDQSFYVRNTGEAGSILVWDATDTLTSPDWLSYVPDTGEKAEGASPAEVVVSVDAGVVGAGDYTAVITVSGHEKTSLEDAAGGPQTVTVYLSVGTRAEIALSPGSFSFQADEGGTDPVSQTLVISNPGDAPLNWSVGDDAAWLDLAPASGTCTTGTDSVTVLVDISGLVAGPYSATITVTAPGASNTPRTVGVTLTVSAPPRADLVIESITQSPTSPSPDETVIFTVTVRNQGDLDAALFNVGFWSDLATEPAVGDPPDQNADIGSLGAGASGAVQFTVTAPSVEANYKAWAYADRRSGGEVSESDESNNAGPTGGHTWSVSTGDSYEDDNSFATAKPIADGETQEHSIRPVGDMDYVTFSVSGTQGVLLELHALPSDTMYLRIYDSTQTLIDSESINSLEDTATIRSTLGPGTYYARVEEWNNDSTVDSYTLRIEIGPALSVRPDSISVSCPVGMNVASQTIQIVNAGGGGFTYLLSESAGWLSCTPTSGSLTSNPNTVTVDFTTSGLSLGPHSTSITVSAAGAAGSPVVVVVTVNVVSPPAIDTLSFDVIDAEYSRQLDRIIMVSASPHRLHIYDPVAQSDTTVALPYEPKCVSVGPTGLEAAVGHDDTATFDSGYVMHVDLSTASVINSHFSSADVRDVVLAGNGYVYVFPWRDQWERIRCILLSSGLETMHTGSFIYAATQPGNGTVARLHPGGSAIYGADGGISPSDIEKYDISGGTAAYLYDSAYHGAYPMSGNLWISDDGLRIFVRGGHVFTSSDTQAEDMAHVAGLDGCGLIRELAQSGAADELALIPNASDSQIRTYVYSTLSYSGGTTLPEFGGYLPHGRFVFYNSDGSKYYVVIQADAAAGLTDDFAIVAY